MLKLAAFHDQWKHWSLSATYTSCDKQTIDSWLSWPWHTWFPPMAADLDSCLTLLQSLCSCDGNSNSTVTVAGQDLASNLIKNYDKVTVYVPITQKFSLPAVIDTFTGIVTQKPISSCHIPQIETRRLFFQTSANRLRSKCIICGNLEWSRFGCRP